MIVGAINYYVPMEATVDLFPIEYLLFKTHILWANNIKIFPDIIF